MSNLALGKRGLLQEFTEFGMGKFLDLKLEIWILRSQVVVANSTNLRCNAFELLHHRRWRGYAMQIPVNIFNILGLCP